MNEYDCAYCPLGGVGEPTIVDDHPAHPACAAAVHGDTPEQLAAIRLVVDNSLALR
jgi:hypothetical protein